MTCRRYLVAPLDAFHWKVTDSVETEEPFAGALRVGGEIEEPDEVLTK